MTWADSVGDDSRILPVSPLGSLSGYGHALYWICPRRVACCLERAGGACAAGTR